MKSEYMPSHLGGSDSTSVVRCVACLYIAGVAPGRSGLLSNVGAAGVGGGIVRGQEAGALLATEEDGGEVIDMACAALPRSNMLVFPGPGMSRPRRSFQDTIYSLCTILSSLLSDALTCSWASTCLRFWSMYRSNSAAPFTRTPAALFGLSNLQKERFCFCN